MYCFVDCCSCKLFLPSPRNASTTNVQLLEHTKCHKILFAKEAKPVVDQIAQDAQADSIEVPSFEDMATMRQVMRSANPRRFEAVKDNPVLILHSSGSTG